MAKRKRIKNILIEVAAQHPLIDGRYPNDEFTKRLDVSIELRDRLIKDGYNVEIFVPGSVHLDSDGIPEEVSLSEAGIEYLKKHGIPEENLHGLELEEQYCKNRNWKGIYNTADECFIAANYYLNYENGFSSLYTICSPNQLMRKSLFYIEFGILPKIITVPADRMFHDFVNEVFNGFEETLVRDHSWQGEDSKEAIRTRKERCLDFQE